MIDTHAFRTDPDEAKRVIEKLLPDLEARILILDRFAASVDEAHRLNPEGWESSLAQSESYASLNVGGMTILQIKGSAIAVALDSGQFNSGELSGERIFEFKKVPGVALWRFSHSHFVRNWGELEPSHMKAVERGSRQMTRSPWWTSHASGLVEYVANTTGVDLSQPAYVEEIPKGPIADFTQLFEEFVDDYLSEEEGQAHLAFYDEMRASGRANFQAIKKAAGRGENVTEQVLLRLLPYSRDAWTTEIGAWQTTTPALKSHVKKKFEGARWVDPKDWPQVADAILKFLQTCESDPKQLDTACSEFSSNKHSKGFQSGMLSPILNALRPDDYLIINKKPLLVINWLAATSFGPSLESYPSANARGLELIDELAESLSQIARVEARPSDLFDEFCHWAVAVKKPSPIPTGKQGDTATFWKIAPGKGAHLWDTWRRQGILSIGWSDLGDLVEVSKSDFTALQKETINRHPNWTKSQTWQVWRVAKHMKVGDRIVANRGTGEVLGIGMVAGDYYFVEGERHGHRRQVTWDDTRLRRVNKPAWKRTLIKLKAEEFAEIQEATGEPGPVSDSPFSRQTFDLLEGLHNSPTKDFYNANKEAFKQQLEDPFHDLLQQVIAKLPPAITDVMETKKNIFSRILKNDYGRGGAWDFYWGALYPKGGKRIADPQLFIWISQDRLEFGFYVGEYGKEARDRFLRNRKEYLPFLLEHLTSTIGSASLSFGERRQPVEDDVTTAGVPDSTTWEGWLDDPASAARVLRILNRKQCLAIPKDELVHQITSVFKELFPLVLLSVSEDPAAEIAAYSGIGEEDLDRNPEYSLSACATDTGFRLDLLKSWVRAIERKGQAVLYGPPGTGKTFIAEKLADHLIGSGTGFKDLVQFHPSYAYEDFIQGIRPNTTDSGQLTFGTAKGRFWDFCSEARRRMHEDRDNSTCVLIIDEINRANLSRVFGELMYLLEYRDREVPMAGGGRLRIPENVRIIGTMNTADRSIALVDHALRRRFAFLALRPNLDVLAAYHEREETGFDPAGLISSLEDLNAAIGDPNYAIGISFFLRSDLSSQLEDIWRMEIEPYLEEYFFDQNDKVEKFRWAKIAERVMG